MMRWDNLTVESEESRALPGYREPATVRTFEAPEAMDTRFYEVQLEIRAEPRAEGVADAVPVDDQSLSRMHACVLLLPSG